MTTEPAARASGAPDPKPAPFPRSFWTANVTELFERAAYYAMASWVVIYLGQLGLGKYWPSTLNSWLWFLVYFLPILSGTIADRVGFRKSLLFAFVLLCIGYTAMGYPVWFGGAALVDPPPDAYVAPPGVFPLVLAGILFIGLGGSVIKPCISGTVQKTAGLRATLGFGIFYTIINLGSLTGRGTAYVVRTRSSLAMIFAVAAAACVVAFMVVLLVYRDPEQELGTAAAKPRKSIARILADMVIVLRNPRFTLFLLVTTGFFFLYSQVYNVLPLYLKKVVETKPPVDLYTMANPLVIVCFQLLVTKLFGKWKPIVSMMVGTAIIAAAFVLNLVPVYLAGGLHASFADLLPLGSLFIVLTIAAAAFGELFASARVYEYIGALAPKGQEGLFLGYANLPMALGALIGGPVGAAIFNEVMCKGATKLPSGLLELDRGSAARGWIILMLIGLVSAAGVWVYHRWLEKQKS
ncbi:MAG TPA: MFS transporter [Polyangia bacterium]